MKLRIFTIIIILCLCVIQIKNEVDYTRLLTRTLKQENSDGIIQNINNILDQIYTDENFRGIYLRLSREDEEEVKDKLLDDYKNKFSDFYKDLLGTQTDEEIKDSLFSTIKEIIDFYFESQQPKPRLVIGERSAISLNSLEESYEVHHLLEKDEKDEHKREFSNYLRRYYSEANLSNYSGLRNQRANNSNNNNERRNDRNNKNKRNGGNGYSFLQRKIKIKNRSKIIDNSEQYVAAFLTGNHRNIHTDVLDYSTNPAFFHDQIHYQGDRGVCYASAAAMLFSFYINIRLSRRNEPHLIMPMEFANIAVCATHENDQLTDSEIADLEPFKYSRFFPGYKLNRGDLIGVVGPTTVWIKHHLSMMYAYQYIEWKKIPRHKYFRTSYTPVCNFLQEKNKLNEEIDEFQYEIEPVRSDLENAHIVNIHDAFNNMNSIRKQLLEHGPFIFRIVISGKASRFMGNIHGDDTRSAFISINNCNRFLNTITTGRHYLIAVGYGYLDDRPYLKFKNSWGDHWGHNGYGYLEMNDNGSACNYRSASRSKLGNVAIQETPPPVIFED